MTATFGKLSHQTLTLEPGLNVINAPNEWGKSTWCAFLCAMLYGIDTRERTTQTSLADKERYAPWSGEPMSGKLDLSWNGKDITIERRTKGRSIFGDFRAYETASGLEVPGMTGDNCGEILLGVEKAVFTRSAFIRLSDMPVTQDDALRRRLNALVTTGDENDAGDALAQKLKELKNKCRHNKTGLLPQAEAQRNTLADKLDRLHGLQAQVSRIRTRQTALDEQVKLLENHLSALAYEASREDARRVDAANAACLAAAQKLEAITSECESLPARETAEDTIVQLEQLLLQQEALQAETLPPAPEKPEAPTIFAGMTPEQALQQAKSDKSAFDMLCRPLSPVLPILAIASLLAGIAGLLLVNYIVLIPFLLLAAILFTAHLRSGRLQKQDRAKVQARYRLLPPEEWVPAAEQYSAAMASYAESEAAYRALSARLDARRTSLEENIEFAAQGLPLDECLDGWRETLCAYDELQEAQRAYLQMKEHADALAAMAKLAEPPAFDDSLTHSQPETERLLAEATAEHRQLHLNLGQCLGQMEALGQEEALQQQLAAVQARIARLEDTYSALTLALETLAAASGELQRRFAPRIAQRAQELFGKLTGSRYDRLQLTQDLSLHAGAAGEDTLRGALWRSDGTVDQLYLALRLAVAEELTPDAPLVLDDAFVRFDDTRLSLAMDILKESARERQILLFTCQGREAGLIG